MSTEITKDIICPQCGMKQPYGLFSSINVAQNPELKQLLLKEELFDWRCKRCNYFANMAYPFIYTDPDKKLTVCFVPAGTKSTVDSSGIMPGFKKREVKNLAELKEKILIFDANLNDVAVELVKSALTEILKEGYKVSRLHAYFSRENEGQLEFAVFLPGKNDALYHSTEMKVYTQSEEVLRTLDYRDGEGFIVVDKKLATRILEDYQNV